jgi:hypothetical protein
LQGEKVDEALAAKMMLINDVRLAYVSCMRVTS